ncbi:MAG: hypothetical protein JW797_16340 [Bradymonadales bacterium]|nr:hypothetical protein [Bradymonadales bacterium]
MSLKPIFYAVLLALCSVPLTSYGQSEPLDSESGDLSVVLQGLEWGNSHEQVIAHFEQQSRSDFRAEIAGVRDPMRVDEIRRQHEERVNRIRDSYQVFDQPRTGYEVSVLGGEVHGGVGESMLTARTDNAQLYYLFTDDQLFKVVVAYNSAYLGGLEFESFLDQVERRYGPPNSTEMGETPLGIRYLARALWQDELARLRIENRSDLFGTFIMVFSHITLEDRVLQRRGGQDNAQPEVPVSDLVRQLSRPTTSTVNEDVVDELIGGPTVVDLTVPESSTSSAPPVPSTEAAAVSSTAEEETTEPSEEATSSEEESSSRRRHRRQQTEAETQSEEEGITIY